jgi:hypothetical protein
MTEDEIPEPQGENEGASEAEIPQLEAKPSGERRYKSAEELALLAGGMTVPEAEKKLTDFQRKLVHNIVYKSMDRATACKAAGSTVEDVVTRQQLAWQTLRKPHVNVYFTYLTEKKNELAGVDKVEVIEGLRDILTLCVNDGKYKEALKALELMGSAIGLFKNVSHSVSKKPDKTSSIIDSGDNEEGSAEAGVKKDIDKLLKLVMKPKKEEK